MDIPGGSLQDIRRDRLCNGRVSKAAPLSLRHREGFPLLPSSLSSSYSHTVAAWAPLSRPRCRPLPQAAAPQTPPLHLPSTLLQLDPASFSHGDLSSGGTNPGSTQGKRRALSTRCPYNPSIDPSPPHHPGPCLSPAFHRGATRFFSRARGGSRKEPRRNREAGTNTPGLCQSRALLPGNKA